MSPLFRRNPLKKLESEYFRLLEEARDLQRAGDIQGFAAMTAKAEALAVEIDAKRDGDGKAEKTP